MTDLQRIVDELRFALRAQVCEQTEALRERAVTYAAACNAANDRLRRCDDLLRRNLRSEAIHLAEAEPNLLDLVATLDFPEREEWADIAALYDMGECEPLLIEIAQDLNQAYSNVQPLQKLLARHRLLALSHAPLNERLEVMRLLDGLDEGAFFWDDDIREFERARFQEIDQAAREAARMRDEASIASLLEELKTSDWREEVPSHLAPSLRRRLSGVSRSGAHEQLPQLTAELELAFGELDLPRARNLRARWLEAAAKAKLPENDSARDRVEPILGWILDEDAREEADRGFQSSLASLDRALDDEASLDEIERLYHASQRFDRMLPEPVKVRYQDRIRSLQLENARARQIKIGFVVALLAGVAILATFLTRKHQENALVATLVESVEPLIASGAYDRAREQLAAQPELTGRSEIVSLQTRIADDEQRDGERKTRFEAEITRATQAADYSSARITLAEARRHVRFDSELVTLEDLTRTWEQRQKEILARAEAAFQKDLETATGELQQLEAAAAEDPGGQDVERLLQTLSARIRTLRGASQSLRPELTGSLELIASRHKSCSDLRQATLTRRALANKLTSVALIHPQSISVTESIGAFCASLTEYSDALSDDPRAGEMRQTIAEQRHWAAALAWNQKLRAWTGLWPVDMDQVSVRIAECEALLKDGAQCPESGDILEYLAALKSIYSRESGSGTPPSDSLRARLRRVFSHDLIQDAWYLKTGDGRMYYVARDEDYSKLEDKIPVSPIHRTGYDMADIKRARDLKAGNFANRTPYAAGQNKVAKKILDRTNVIALSEWEKTLLEIASELHAATEIDSFLRYDLLCRALEIGSAGSVFFKSAVEPQFRHLKSASIDPLARWMDPTDGDASRARESALQQLKSMPEFGDVMSRAAEARLKFEARMRNPHFMVGWLEQIDGEWQCHSNWTTESEHDLYVAYCDKPENRSEWRRIGEATTEGVRISASERSFLKNGRPVFALRREAVHPAVTADNN